MNQDIRENMLQFFFEINAAECPFDISVFDLAFSQEGWKILIFKKKVETLQKMK